MYKIGIIAKNKQDARDMIQIIKEDCMKDRLVISKMYRDEIIVYSGNGVKYTGLSTGNENALRGSKFDQVIYDPFIYNGLTLDNLGDFNLLRCRIEQMLIGSRLPECFENLKIQEWRW